MYKLCVPKEHVAATMLLRSITQKDTECVWLYYRDQLVAIVSEDVIRGLQKAIAEEQVFFRDWYFIEDDNPDGARIYFQQSGLLYEPSAMRTDFMSFCGTCQLDVIKRARYLDAHPELQLPVFECIDDDDMDMNI